jgi:hypothetical protein
MLGLMSNRKALLTERWHRVGEKLRARSPEAFEKTIRILLDFAADEDELHTDSITETYLDA